MDHLSQPCPLRSKHTGVQPSQISVYKGFCISQLSALRRSLIYAQPDVDAKWRRSTPLRSEGAQDPELFNSRSRGGKAGAVESPYTSEPLSLDAYALGIDGVGGVGYLSVPLLSVHTNYDHYYLLV